MYPWFFYYHYWHNFFRWSSSGALLPICLLQDETIPSWGQGNDYHDQSIWRNVLKFLFCQTRPANRDRILIWNEYEKAVTVQEEDAEEVDNFGQGGFNRARKFIWELFEEPNKSKLGKVVTLFLELDLMACQRLLARTQLMPAVELYSHQLHLNKPTARAHFVHFVLVHTTHAVLSCTGQWMCSNHQKQLLQLSQLPKLSQLSQPTKL